MQLPVSQVAAVVACVPMSSTFDYTAGAVFGLAPGIVLVFALIESDRAVEWRPFFAELYL